MAEVPAAFLDLMNEKKAFAHLATLMPDGTPQVTPVWFDYVNDAVRVNTAKGRVKARNMGEGAAVALSILDPDNAYRYVQIRGRVRRMTEEGADAHIDALAKKYLNADKYPFGPPRRGAGYVRDRAARRAGDGLSAASAVRPVVTSRAISRIRKNASHIVAIHHSCQIP